MEKRGFKENFVVGVFLGIEEYFVMLNQFSLNFRLYFDTFQYSATIARSSHQRYSIKKVLLEFCKIRRKALVPESFFDKVVNFFYRTPSGDCF